MSSAIHIDPDLRKAAGILRDARSKMGLSDFPFSTRLSMRLLVQEWMDLQDSDNPHLRGVAMQVGQYVDENPSLTDPYDDLGQFVSEHHEIVHLLFAGVFPLVIGETSYGYAAPPFATEPFFITLGLQDLLSDANVQLDFETFTEFDKVPYVIRACFIILDKYYDISLDYGLPFLFSLNDRETNMDRFYKTTSTLDFLQVKAVGAAPEIPSDRLDFLLSHLNDADLWLETFSPDVFQFEGFFLATMNDVTEVETMSRLRKMLLTTESVLERESATKVADLTRVYLNLPKVEVGIFALDFPFDVSKASRYEIHYPIIEGVVDYLLTTDEKNVYRTACVLNKIQVISDLKNVTQPDYLIGELISAGFRSLMVVPLWDHKKKIIGIMELASTRPYVFTHVIKLKIKEILPLYDVAIEENKNAVDNNIKSLMQEKFTAIHPSVQWRFWEAACDFLYGQNKGEDKIIDRITFEDVYPLHAQIDIKKSTLIRNEAAYTDVDKNLNLLYALISQLAVKDDDEQLELFSARISEEIENIKIEFNINRENEINHFITYEVHPLLNQHRIDHEDSTTLIDAYFDELDSEQNLIYTQRSKYDISLKKINSTIANYLDAQEKITQRVIPHYFEKSKTDGVDYTIYAGQSILKDVTFEDHHFRYLRKWQVQSMCDIYGRLEQLRKDLPLDMSLSYLILTRSHGLSIKFRTEEKHFDIDGSQHTHFEILKKNLDKSLVKETRERLTQGDKMSIVYLQESDKLLYSRYLEDLAAKGLIQPEIEDLEIEPVQGIDGLRALRATFMSSQKTK